jgi:hypothetical protein
MIAAFWIIVGGGLILLLNYLVTKIKEILK